MAERYVRPTVAGWLTPTLIAPWLTSYAAATAIAALGIERGIVGKVVGWAVLMLAGSVWSLAYCLLLVLVDLALLAVKVRTLPAGRRGWMVSLLSPLAVFATYRAVPPHQFYTYGPWAVLGAVIAPMVVVAMASRVAAGLRPPR